MVTIRMLLGRLMLLVLLGGAACAGAEPAAPRPTPRPLFGAYYYPWYFPQRWQAEPVTHHPRLGSYSSSDRAVTAQHVKWAKAADIDFFLVSWITPNGAEDKNLKQALLPELANQDFRFALLYDTALALNLPAGKPLDFDQWIDGKERAGERFVGDFDYLCDTYLTHENYLTFGGRKVVCLYLVRDMVNAGPYLELVRQRLKKRGIELYLIADCIYWAPAASLDWPFLSKHFQAVTAYNMYHRPDFLELVKRQFQDSDALARRHGLVLIPNAMPGYDDTKLRGADRPAIDRESGSFYSNFWDVAAAFVKSDQPFLLITSFNEWHEGTELEPSEEHEDRYLELTKKLIAQTRDRVAPGR